MKKKKEKVYFLVGACLTAALFVGCGKEKKEKTFHYEGGIREFVTYLNKSKTPLYEDVMYFEGKKDNVYVEVAMQHNDSFNDSTFSFVNNVITPEGGTHLAGFRNALTKTFNTYARENKRKLSICRHYIWNTHST